MQHQTPDNPLETLLALYNQEIDKLKEKLLNGETWEATKSIRNNITELAITLQKSYNYVLAGPAKPGMGARADSVSALGRAKDGGPYPK